MKAPMRITATSTDMRPKIARIEVDGAYRNVKICLSYKEQKPLWGALDNTILHLMYHLSDNGTELKLSLDEVIKSTWRMRFIKYGNRVYHGLFIEEIYMVQEEAVVEQSTETAVIKHQDTEEATEAAQAILETNSQRHEEENDTAMTTTNELSHSNTVMANIIGSGHRGRRGKRITRSGFHRVRNKEVFLTDDHGEAAQPPILSPSRAHTHNEPDSPITNGHETACKEIVAIVKKRGKFKDEKWNHISYQLLESLKKSGMVDLIKLMKYLLKHYKKELQLDWVRITDYRTLFENLNNELNFVNKRQSYQHKNILQILKFQSLYEGFYDSRNVNFYFQRVCFELYHTYNLDASQICEVLDFFSDRKHFAFENIDIVSRPKYLKNSWFYQTKMEWMKKKFIVDDPQIFQHLAKLRWTVQMFEFAWKKFGNTISYEAIEKFTSARNNLDLPPFQSLKLLVETTSFEEMIEKAELLEHPRNCYSLFKLLNCPRKFEVCWPIIANNENGPVIERLVRFFRKRLKDSLKTIKKLKQTELDNILIYFCQSIIFNSRFKGSKAKEQLTKLIKDTTLGTLEKAFSKTVVQDIFHKEAMEETDIQKIIAQICGNDEDTQDRLEDKYDKFTSAWDRHTPSGSRSTVSQESEESEEIIEQDYIILVKTIKAMNKLKSITNKPFTLRKVQLLTVLYMAFLKDPNEKGVLCRMFTGEGKTIVVGVLAAFFALKEKIVHIVTSSPELSIPQMEELSGFYAELGLQVGAFGNNNSNQDTNLGDCNIVYGTVSEFIRENLINTNIFDSSINVSRDSDMVIVDEVDNMLIDRSSGLVQLSSVETAALMPLVYPILIKIYFQVRKEYGNYVAPETYRDCPLEVQEKDIIKALKESFRGTSDDHHPFDKRNYLETHIKKLSRLFPRLDESTSDDAVSFFASDNIVYMPKIPVLYPIFELKKLIAKDLDGKPSDFKFYHGSVSGNSIEAWLFLKDSSAKTRLLQCKHMKIGADVFPYENPKSQPLTLDSKFQMSEYIKSDLKFSVMIAKALDKECSFPENKGIEMFLNEIRCDNQDLKPIYQNIRANARLSSMIVDLEKFIFDYTNYMESKMKLDFTIGYLRYVHLYSYYSGTQFENTGKILCKELYPIMRQCGKIEDLLYNIAERPYLKRDFQPLQKLGKYQHIRENYRRGRRMTLKGEYVQLITSLPVTMQEYCLLQFDTWVENCYKAIMYISKDVGYVRDDRLGKNIKIDSKNTGVLQQNMLLADGLQQFLSMKENSVLNPISLTSSFQGIVDFFEGYTTLFGLTGTIGDENTKNFLKKTYKVSIVEIPSHFRSRLKQEIKPYRCYELPGLVYTNSSSWIQAIAETVRQQLFLNRPVLVFCESVRALKDTISPTLMDICQNLPFKVKIIRYDATTKFQEHDRDINKRTLIIATNIAGRGIDFKISKNMTGTGGMHVCLTYLPSSQRVELQCVGRTGRTGQVGSAQLILMDPNGRTIEKLKHDRDSENKRAIQEAENTINKLAVSAKVALLFKNHMEIRLQAVSVDNSEQEVLTDMLLFLPEICEQLKKSIFYLTEDEKKNFIVHYEEINGRISEKVKECFLKLEKVVPRLSYSAYTRTVAGLLLQRYSFWMKRHCFNRSRVLNPDIELQFKVFLDNQNRIFDMDTNPPFEHHVFTAREAFRVLLDKENTNQTMNDVFDLFDRSGIVELAKSNTEPAQRFEGLALYYYAGYLCKKLSEEDLEVKSLKRIVNILGKCKTYIDHDIIQSLERARNMLVPVNMVYNQLDFITQIFRNLNDGIIIPLINTLKANIHSKDHSKFVCEFIEFDPLLLTFSSEDQYFKEQKMDISETVVSHAHSFGLFGYFVVQFNPKPENIEVMRKGLRLFRFKRSDFTRLYTTIKSVLNFMQLRRNTVSDDTVEHEFISFNIHTQRNFICNIDTGADFDVTDAMNRLELYLAMMGKSKGTFSPLAKSILMNKQTENGISEANSSSDNIDPYIYEGMEIFLKKKETFDAWKVKSDKVADINENIRVKEVELQSIYTRALNAKFLEQELQDKFVPLFVMDAAYGHYENENILKQQVSDEEVAEVRSEISIYARRLFRALSIDSNSSCDEDAITLYVKMILGELEEVVENLSELATQQLSAEKAAPYKAVALSRYKGFIAFAIKPFLRQVRVQIHSYFAESKDQAEEDMALSNRDITRALATDIEEKLKKKENKTLATCPMCNERVILGNRLNNLSEGFRLILVFYSVPNRTQIFYPREPVGVEKILWNPTTKQWTMRQRNAPCILDLMIEFHGYPDLEKLTNSINQLEVESPEQLLEYDINTTINNTTGWHTSKHAIRECYMSLYRDPSSTILDRENRQKLLGYHQVNVEEE